MQKFENTLWSGKCLSGEMSIRRSVLRGSVRSGNCLFGEMSVGEVSVGDLSSGKCQSGKCPVGKLSYNRLGGAILMELSMANHDLLIVKLHTFGFQHNVLKLLHSYLTKCWPRTKVNMS